MKCGICKRPLKTPRAILFGVGSVCAKRTVIRLDLFEFGNFPPFEGDILCKRNSKGKAFFNIPHSIVKHSPMGMEWGYGGSGPADFALNILCQFVEREEAEGLYQIFKWDFVAKIPEKGGVILREKIASWILKKRVILGGNQKGDSQWRTPLKLEQIENHTGI